MKICIIDFDFTNFGGVEHVTASIANKFAEDFIILLFFCIE